MVTLNYTSKGVKISNVAIPDIKGDFMHLYVSSRIANDQDNALLLQLGCTIMYIKSSLIAKI